MGYVGLSAKNDIRINATSDLELTSDNTTIKFGADDDVTITHDPDDGLIFKSIATADDNPFLLTIQTGETDLAANDVIGKIQFQAPDEGTGTDAILVSAAIQAVAEGDFSSSSNATSLQFMTGSSEAAATKMTLSSAGNVGVGVTPTHQLHVLTTDDKGFLLDRNTTNNPASLNEFSSYYSLSIKNRNSGSYLNFGGNSSLTTIQATDGAGSATAKNIALQPYGGKVGVGDDSPDNKMNIKESALGSRSASNGNTSLTIEHATDTGIQFFSATQTQLRFGDAASTGAGSIIYTHSDNALKFNTGEALALTIDGNRDVIISDGGNLETATAGTSNFRAGVNAGDAIASGGNYNVVVGDEAGTAITTGDFNTALGYEALAATTDRNSNTSIGAQTLKTNVNGAKNTAVGSGALFTMNPDSDVDTYNTAVGFDAGNDITTGDSNTLIGGLAGDALTEGKNNVAMGYGALGADTKGKENVAIGNGALGVQNFTSLTNAFNTAVGSSAGYGTTTGIKNTFIGAQAGDANAIGFNNVAIGYDAMGANTASGANVAIGYESLLVYNNTSEASHFNTAVGTQSGKALTTGIKNTIIGGLAGDQLADADFNTAVGYGSLSTDDLGSKSTAVGTFALEAQNYASATDSHNTAVGYIAGGAITTGVSNTIFGSGAGDALTDADYNLAVGTYSLSTDTLGSKSTAIGYGTLYNQNFTSATNTYNTAVGYEAGHDITTGTGNTFVGFAAGDKTLDSDNNTAMGYQSLGADSGGDNTGFGAYALYQATGSDNTAVGPVSGHDVTSGSNNIFVGHDTGISGSPGGSQSTGSNEIFLGDENISAANIQVDWTVASDERDKTDFTALDLGLDFVKAMKPYTFKWDKRSKYGDKTSDDFDLNTITSDGTHKEDWLDLGFKAQDVKALEEASNYKIADKTNLTVSITNDGKQYGMKYAKLVPILVKAIQELSAEVTKLKGE
jgi:hypothetical protein